MQDVTAATNPIRFYDNHEPETGFHREVIDGLSRRPRFIPPKYFYDEQGSLLFEAICEQPEYYVTRTEFTLLKQYAGEIAALMGTGCFLIEPGSGACEKVRMLLSALRPECYIPMDISGDHLQSAAKTLAFEYPWLDVHAVCADITDSLSLPFIPFDAKRVIFYPGSSIGNFEPGEAESFLRDLAKIAGPGGCVLIGVDLKKDAQTLSRAYNDANGITAEFNLNLLHRINRELDGDIDVDAFHHHAFYNENAGRIEMHLVSSVIQTVRVDGHKFEFDAGENIHTENSYKYSVSEFQALASRAGFRADAVWTDEKQLFSLHFLRNGEH